MALRREAMGADRAGVDPVALWVVPVAELGGVARHVLDVAASGLPGYRLVVLCPEGPLAEELRRVGAAVLASRIGPDVGVPTSVASMRHVLRTLRPQVLHSHLAYADLVCVLATATLRRRPVVVTTEHGIAAEAGVYHRGYLTARTRELVHHLRLRRTDMVIAVSRSTAQVMQRRWQPRGPVAVVLNGVDRAPASSRAAGLRVLSLARLAPEKRLDVLVAAFAVIAREHPDARLTIAGEGPLRAEIEGQVERLGLADQVDLVGHVDAADVLGRADVLVQLSAWENASYSLLDAVVAGRGVVATRVGGNPEILPEQCLVELTDPADVLAARIVEQGTRPEARPTLGAQWPDVAAMCAQIASTYAR